MIDATSIVALCGLGFIFAAMLWMAHKLRRKDIRINTLEGLLEEAEIDLRAAQNKIDLRVRPYLRNENGEIREIHALGIVNSAVNDRTHTKGA